MTPLLIYHGCRSSRRAALLGQAAFPSEVTHLPTVEAWKIAGRKLLWWLDGSLMWWRGFRGVGVALHSGSTMAARQHSGG
jgi:hypothetical protein